MGESGKSAAYELAGEASAGPKRQRPQEMEAEGGAFEKAGEGEEDDILAWLCAADETAAGGLVELLEGDAQPPPPPRETSAVRFIDDPYSPLLVFQSSSSFVTINGNEETCGSSFSDSEASVMASVHHIGGADALPGWTMNPRSAAAAIGGGGWVSEAEGVRGKAREDGTDGCDWNDEMLARFLSEDEEDGDGVWSSSSSIWA